MHMKNRRRLLRYKANLSRLRLHAMKLGGMCPICGQTDLYLYNRYDADFCYSCNEWISPSCNDPKCPYCSERPDTPAEALFRESHVNRRKKDCLRQNYQHKTDGMNRRKKKRILYDEIKNNR